MINIYYRPQSIEDALRLLKEPGNILLNGYSSEHAKVSTNVNVVDIQDLRLNKILKNSISISIGSTATLQEMIISELIPGSIKTAIELDAPLNIRTITSLGSNLLTWTGRSCLATVLLAMDAVIQFADKGDKSSLTQFNTNLENNGDNQLISQIEIPITRSVFKYISATPASRPYICTSLSYWSNGRTRLTLGGYGAYPTLVVDGTLDDDLVNAARNAYSEAGDEWASATYRSEMAAKLTERCIHEIKSNNS